MTKNEALKAAIDGKKIQHKYFSKDEYVFWECPVFMYTNSGRTEPIDTALDDKEDDWQIAPETVDFFTAWKAYEEGKTIQSTVSSCTFRKAFIVGPDNWFNPTEIRGKWIILEDE